MKHFKASFVALFLVLFSLFAQQDFEFPRDLQQFGLGKNLKVSLDGPNLSVEITDRDSYILTPKLSLDTAQIGRLAIEYRASGFPGGKTSGEIFYLTPSAQEFSADRCLQLPSLVCDGEWHTLTVSASRNRDGGKAWREAGKVTQLRLDLVNEAPGKIDIRKINFLPDVPPLPTGTCADIWNLPGGQYADTRNLTVDTLGEFLTLNITAADSSVFSPALSLDPARLGQVVITYRATGFRGQETDGELFYRSQAYGDYSGKFYIPLSPLKCDGEWHQLTISANQDCEDGGKAWRNAGEITGLRLDLVNQYPGTIEIKDMEFLPDLPELVFDPAPRVWDFTQGLQDWNPLGWETSNCGPEGFVGHCRQGETVSFVSPRIHADTKDFNTLRVVLRTDSSALLLLDRGKNMNRYDGCANKQVVHASQEFQVYEIPLAIAMAGPTWKGTLEKFRLRFQAPEDGTWEIRRIEFFQKEENLLSFAEASPYRPGLPLNWQPEDATAKVEFLNQVPESFRLSGHWRNSRISLPFPSSLQISGRARGKSSFTVKTLDFQGQQLSEETYALPETADWEKFLYTLPEPELAASAILLLDGNFENPHLVESSNIVQRKIDPASKVVNWKANWIWHQGWFNKDNHTIWFRRDFTIDNLEQVTKAELELCADDRFTLEVNGRQPGKSNIIGNKKRRSFKDPTVYDIKPFLQAGANRIFVKVDQVVSSSGLLLEAAFCTDTQELLHLATDETWECAVTPDGPWTTPLIIGNPPCQPWGKILFVPIGLLPKVETEVANLPWRVKPGEQIALNLNLKLLDDTETALLPQLKLFSEDGKTVLWMSKEDDCQKVPARSPAGTALKIVATLKIPEYLPRMETTLEISLLGADNSKPITFPLHIDGPAERDFPQSEMRSHNGVVSMFVNGQPASLTQALLNDSGGAQVRNLGLGEVPIADVSATLCFYETGVDYSDFDQKLADYLNARPGQNLMLDVNVSAKHSKWYLARHPELLCLKENGDSNLGGYSGLYNEICESQGAEGYRRVFGDLLRKMLLHYQDSPFASRIVGVHLSGGLSSEWFLPGSQAADLIDYSEAGLRDFRKYLRSVYATDEALQTAWKQPGVTFETATIPTGKERTSPSAGFFFDPATQQQIIDYNRFQHRLNAETIDYFASIVKEISSDKLIVGAYYSYCINLAEAEYGNGQGSGHFDAARIFALKHLDYFCAPTNYAGREMGEPTAAMGLPHGYGLHNMVWLDQADFRTHWQPVRGFGRSENLTETISTLRREFGRTIAEGSYIQWYDFSFGWIFGDARICEELRRLQKLEDTYRPQAKPLDCEKTLLVVMDERQIGRFNIFYPLYGTELIRNQGMYLSTAGIPFRIVFFQDLQEFPELLQHKTMLLLNLFYLNNDDVAFLRDKILVPGRTVAVVGPLGLQNDDRLQPDRASNLLGIPFQFEQKPLNLCTVLAKDNPLDAKLAGHKFGNRNPDQTYNPNLLPLPADNLQVIGTLASNSAQPSLVLRRGDQEHCQLLYSLAPGLSPEVLRLLAKVGGLPVLSDQNDPLFCGHGFILVHAASDGQKVIQLPDHAAETVELFSGQTWPAGTKAVTVDMKLGDNILLFQK